GSLTPGQLGHHRAHRNKESNHTCRESSSFTHGQLQGYSYSTLNLKSLSPSEIRRMYPAGLPLTAGRMVTLSGSPGLIVFLPNPCKVRLVTEAVVNVQSTSLRVFLSSTVSTMLACGLTKFSFLSLPSITI